MLFPNHTVRQYATLKDIQTRLKAIKNIGKITKSMKMIASTKLNRAQKTAEIARVFGESATEPIKQLSVGDTSKDYKEAIIVACSSDRGLCGAIHSSISKLAKSIALSNPDVSIVVLGDKAKPQIARSARKQICVSVNQLGKDTPTFSDALAILKAIGESEARVLERPLIVLFNRFKSVIAYESGAMPSVLSRQSIIAAGTRLWTWLLERLNSYEYTDEALDAYVELNRASCLYWALAEGHVSEMSAKRMAMENASKNADNIAAGLTMQYNRTRQAVITNELCDIITGASAL